MQKENGQALNERKIRSILFDLGETLWTDKNRDTTLNQAVTQQTIQIIRTHVIPEIFAQVDLERLQNQLRHSVVMKARAQAHSHPGYEPDFGQAVNDALPQFGLPPLERSVSEAIFEDLRIPIFGTRRLFDDVQLTLQTLKQRGFLLGVVSNRFWGGRPFLADVHKLGLFDYFPPAAIAISADLGIRKPNPDMFRHTLRELNTTPEESVMVGDSLYADVAGAKKLGMLAVWKPKHYQRTKLRELQKHKQHTDDHNDRLFSYALEHENQHYQHAISSIKPDIIIEHVRELLDIFVEVGK